MGGLSVAGLVNVTINLTPSGASALSFGVLMVAGDSNVINGTQRFRSYQNIGAVANDFGTTAPEYLAANLFFQQMPQPSTCMIGRWFSTAAPALNDGGILSVAAQTLSLWTSISSGGFTVVVDGTSYALTGLNFTAATNLNGIATIITAALTTATSTAVCTWNGSNFIITSGTSGIGIQATGTITLTGQPSASDTLTLNGQVITFVSSVTAANQVLIGTNDTATAANLQAFLTASLDPDLIVASYSRVGLVVTITYNTVGTAGNSYSMTKSCANATLSGSDLAGGTPPSSVGYATSPGSGTDISAQLMFTASTAQALVPGFGAEQPVSCAQVLANMSAVWYGLQFSATASISASQNLAISAFIEAQSITRVHGVSTQDSGCLSSLVTTDIASQMQAAGYNQTCVQYSSTTAHVIASFFGRAFSVDFTGNNTTIDLMFKQEPGVVPETLTPAQAAALQAKNCNVFVNYANNTAILQYGVMSGGDFFDEVQGVDWLQNAIQTAVYNVLYTSTTKVPQTDQGVNQITNAIAAACGQGVANGLIAPGTWNGPSFGAITTGQYLKAGYYIYAEPVALQSEVNRAARICPPIQVAVKLAGAIQMVLIAVNVNQ